MPADSVSGEGLIPGSQPVAFWQCPYVTEGEKALGVPFTRVLMTRMRAPS